MLTHLKSVTINSISKEVRSHQKFKRIVYIIVSYIITD